MYTTRWVISVVDLHVKVVQFYAPILKKPLRLCTNCDVFRHVMAVPVLAKQRVSFTKNIGLPNRE